MPTGCWMMDTGCGHDLIGNSMAEGYVTRVNRAPDGQMVETHFAIAGGLVSTCLVVPMNCPALRQIVHPHLLPDTPAVLSIGKRCMEEGYQFVWKPYTKPFLITPDGIIIPLDVEGNIPILRVSPSPQVAVPSITTERHHVTDDDTIVEQLQDDEIDAVRDGNPPDGDELQIVRANPATRQLFLL